jgi:tRNA pseudouridine55 synthase
MVLDKPGGITSRDAVNRVQRLLPRGTRIGHAGTLDPLSTGVLVLLIGAATRLTEFVQQMDKEYRTDLVLGATSTTDDADGEITLVSQALEPSRETVATAMRSFVGNIAQVPPDFSAAKVTGRRAYDLARRGEDVVLDARTVEVHAIELLHYKYPHLSLQVRCGKGTYIRSLARDLGRLLGCGAHVDTLRRTRIGPFTEAGSDRVPAPDAVALPRLLPVEQAVAGLPHVAVSRRQAEQLCNGARIVTKPEPERDFPQMQEDVAIFCEDCLVGIGAFGPDRQTLLPTKILNRSNWNTLPQRSSGA